MALIAPPFVAPGLALVWFWACLAWGITPEVKAVRWCMPAECDQFGGGMFDFQTREIKIDPLWIFRGDDLLLTMEHEVGHALGVEHDAYGIMKPGWDPPFVSGPTEEEKAVAHKLHRMVCTPQVMTMDGVAYHFTFCQDATGGIVRTKTG